MPKQGYKSIDFVNSKTFKFLKASLKVIEKKMKEIIKNQSQLKQKFNLIQSVLGVGQKTAFDLLITTKGFTAFANARNFACYSG